MYMAITSKYFHEGKRDVNMKSSVCVCVYVCVCVCVCVKVVTLLLVTHFIAFTLSCFSGATSLPLFCRPSRLKLSQRPSQARCLPQVLYRSGRV